MNLILSAYSPEEEEIIGLTSFNHLMNALKITVFTSEVNIHAFNPFNVIERFPIIIANR